MSRHPMRWCEAALPFDEYSAHLGGLLRGRTIEGAEEEIEKTRQDAFRDGVKKLDEATSTTRLD